ncbi:MAG: tRNA pseudouridine(38-40) synthase TruA [bacterium]
MTRYRLTVAYDGSVFHGWQVQPRQVTVQSTIEEALAHYSGETVKVHGSGRTDQGVHARGQVAHFDLMRRVSTAGLQKALNAILPDDVRILKTARAADNFDARRSAKGKEYRYFIRNAPVLDPFLHRYRTQIWRRLDIAAMNAAAADLVGVHDFAAYAANPKREIDSTIRNLTGLRCMRRGRDVIIVAAADGFLYKMVRSLCGMLIRVGEGDLPPGEARRILETRERTARVPTAPAAGLFLWRVWY